MFRFPEIVYKPLKFTLPGDSIYLVGGAIRDTLIAKPIKDIDFVVNRDPREIARKLANELAADYFILDEERNTCRVLLNQQSLNKIIFDFAQMRGGTIEEDLMKRDFTINAMAVNLSEQNLIIDPLRGANDLQNKYLRAVTSTSFMDDPIRTIRAIRYAVSLGLKIEKETSTLILSAIEDLDRVSAERKRDEFFKILDGYKVGAAIKLLAHYSIFPKFNLGKNLDFDFAARRAQLLDDFIRISSKCNDHEKRASFIRNSLYLQFSKFSELLFEHFYHEELSGRIRKSLTQFSSLIGNEFEDNDKAKETFALSSDEIQKVKIIFLNRNLISSLMVRDTPITMREIYGYFKETDEVGIDLVFVALAEYASRVGVEFSQEFWLKLLGVGELLLSAWFEQHQVVKPKPLLNGNDLMFRFDLAPGPLIGVLLEDMKEEQAAGVINSVQEAVEWVDQWLLRIKT